MKHSDSPLHLPAELPRKQRCHTCHGTRFISGVAGGQWDCPDCDATGQASARRDSVVECGSPMPLSDDRLGRIIGNTGTQKTAALREYCANQKEAA